MGIKKGISVKYLILGIIALASVPLVLAPAGNECGSLSPCICGPPCQGQFDPQSHEYNTIDSCIDGSNPRYEWVEDLNVTDLNSTTFWTGHTIKVDAFFKCDAGEGDEISINYNNGSGWKVIKTGTCNINGYVHFRKNITLDNVIGTHAMRAVIAWKGVTAGMICGYDYDKTYSDTDDVTFEVTGTQDIEPPFISSVYYPGNNSRIPVKNIDFNFSVSDNGTITNCSLWTNISGNFEINKTLTEVINNNSLVNAIQMGVPDGDFIWNINCIDAAGNSGWYIDNYTLHVDTQNPLLQYLSSTPQNGVYANRTFVVINVSFIDANADTIVLEWNGTNQSGLFSSSGNNVWNATKKSLQGTYTFRVFGNDTFGHSNRTNARTVTLDTQPPAPFSLVLPGNNSKALLTSQLAPLLNWSDSVDSYFSNYLVEVSGSPTFVFTNYSYIVMGPYTNSHYKVTNSWYDHTVWFWRVIAYDYNDNSRISQNAFVYVTNTSQPSVVMVSPDANSFSRQASLMLIYVPYGVGLDQCSLWHNASGIFLRNSTNTSPVAAQQNRFGPLMLPEGAFIWNVLCNDTLGQQAWGATNYSFIIDRTAPRITFDSSTPANLDTVSSRLVTIGVDIDELHNDYVTVSWNGTNESVAFGGSLFSLNITAESDGYFHFRVYSNDTAGNINSTEERQVYVDTTAPLLSNLSVFPYTAMKSQLFTFSADAFDETGVGDVWGIFTMPNGTVIIPSFTQNGSEWYYIFNASLAGGYSVIVCTEDYIGWERCNDTALTFMVEDSPFALSNLSWHPNDTDSLDPGVSVHVNVTVHSVSNISAVVIKFEEQNASSWSVTLMSKLSSGKYSGSFTPNGANNWSFLVWANNTFGQTNWTQIVILPVRLDKTWNLRPADLGSKGAIFGEHDVTIGNFTINNTGDSVLVFNISRYSGEIPIIFNVTDLLIVSAKTRQTVSAKVNAPLVYGSYSLSIRVNSISANAQPAEILLNSTVVSHSPGPFVLVVIQNYDSQLVQGDNVPLLKAKMNNIGNESCANAHVIWSLPSGWSSRESLNISLGNIGIGSIVYDNISADVGELAPTGNQRISAIVYCGNGLRFNDSRIVTVSSISPELPAGPGGGGSSVGGGSFVTRTRYVPADYTIDIDAPEKILAKIGTTRTVNITVRNPNKNTILTNLTMLIDGYYLTRTKVNPSVVANLKYGKSVVFVVEFFVPSYLSEKSYSLKIQVTATNRVLNSSLAGPASSSKSMILVTASVSEPELMSLMTLAQGQIDKLRLLGVNTSSLEEMLASAALNARNSDYKEAKETIDSINELYHSAIVLTASFAEAESRIAASRQRGLNVSLAEHLLMLAKQEFASGRIESAAQILEKSFFAERIQAKTEQAKFISRTIWFIQEHLVILISVVLALVAMGLVVAKQVRIRMAGRELASIAKREQKIYGQMAKTQREHFVERITSGRLYTKTLIKLQDTIADLQYKRIKLLAMRKSPFAKEKTLADEITQLQNLRKDLHLKYYVQKTITEMAFLRLTQLCEERMAKLNEQMRLFARKRQQKVEVPEAHRGEGTETSEHNSEARASEEVSKMDQNRESASIDYEKHKILVNKTAVEQPSGQMIGFLQLRANDTFHFINGHDADTLEQLVKEIAVLSHHQFLHHANHSKNDFAVWIRSSLEMAGLAQLVERQKNAAGIIKVIKDYEA